MKKIVIETDEQDGLVGLLGKRITIFCGNYFYTGDLIAVNDTYVRLTNAAIVYETGELTSSQWKDAQKLPHDWYVQIAAIESYGELK